MKLILKYLNPSNGIKLSHAKDLLIFPGKKEGEYVDSLGNPVIFMGYNDEGRAMFASESGQLGYSYNKIGPSKTEIAQKEDNIRKLNLLKLAGYDISPDGVWTDLLEQLWNSLHAHDKDYDADVWGLMHGGWDALWGQTKYLDNGDELKDEHGTPVTEKSGDEVSKAYRDKYNGDTTISYLQGVPERWKSSMHNNTNPVVGFENTVVPSLLGALLVEETPMALKTAPRVISNVPKITSTIINNPVKTLPYIWKFGKGLVKGAIGGEAVNLATKTLTGQTYPELMHSYLDVPETVGEFTNPGYLAAAPSWGISKSMQEWYKAKKLIPILNKRFAITHNNLNLLHNEQDALFDLQVALNDELNAARHDLRMAESEVHVAQENKTMHDIVDRLDKSIQSENREKGRDFILNSELLEGRLHPSYVTELVSYQNGSSKDTPLPILFTDEAGNTFTSTVTTSGTPRTITLDPNEIPLSLDNGIISIPDNKMLLVYSLGRFGETYTAADKELLLGISLYVDRLNSTLGDDGVVAGSSVHYKNGLLLATENNGLLIGPADTEIYTTEARLQGLKQKLQFTEGGRNSTGGYKGTSPYTFRNNTGHFNEDTEINVIEDDGLGHAIGGIAHLIYRALYPEEYYRLTNGSLLDVSQIPLPVSAEDLLLLLRKDPDALLLHLLSDMIGIETFTSPYKVKAPKRYFSVLFNPNEGVPERIEAAIKARGVANMGPNFKLGSELLPNLSFDDIEANKEFLKTVYRLTEEEASRIASNKLMMKNAFNEYYFSQSTGVRLVPKGVATARTSTNLPKFDLDMELFNGNGAFGNGTAAGPGLNTVLLNPNGGWTMAPDYIAGVRESLLTYHPEEIKSPMDIVKQIEYINSLEPQNSQLKANNLHLTSIRDDAPLKYDTAKMEEIRQQARLRNTPVVYSSGYNGYMGTLDTPVATGWRISTSPYELGSLFKEISSKGTNKYQRLLFSDLPLTAREDILKKALEQYIKSVEDFKAKWATLTPRERAGLFGKKSFGYYYVNSDPGTVSFRPVVPRKFEKPFIYDFKRSLYDVQKYSEKVNSDTKYLRGLHADLVSAQSEYDKQVILDQIENVENALAQSKEHLKRAKEERDAMVAAYEKSKTLLREAEHAAGQKRKKVKLLRRKAERISDKLYELEDETNAVSQNLSTIDDKIIEQKNTRRLVEDKVIKKIEQLGLVGLGLSGATKLKEKNRTAAREERRVLQELEGLRNPLEGAYFTSLIEQGMSIEEADKKVRNAFELYKKKNKKLNIEYNPYWLLYGK